MPVALLLSLSLLQAPTTPEPRQLTPQLSNEVLQNPFMGVYLQYPPLDAKPDEWFMGLSDIAYFRLHWCDVNPEPGVYRFDEFLGPLFDVWVKQHRKRVAFRVMSQSMHGNKEYVTPKWVFDAGVPGVEHVGLSVPRQVNPAFWNQRYLELQAEFIAKLGAWLDGREGLEFVDLGGIGEWGEMHLARWTQADFDATGYTDAGYVAAYRRMIDDYAKAFPRTPVFLNVGGPERLSINDYAAARGMHLRQDGLKHDGASYNVESKLYPTYAPRGTLCNLEFHSGWSAMQQNGWDVPTTFAKALASPIAYLNSNLFGGAGYRKAPPEAREMLLDAARRIGYRFVVTGVELPAAGRVSATLPGRLVVRSFWRNDGIAWSHGSYAVTMLLVNAAGEVVSSDLQYPPTPTTRWDPGASQEQMHRLVLPPGTPAGTYRLLVSMVWPETGRVIQLGLAGRDAAGRYPLGEVELHLSTAVGGVVWQTDFETGEAAGWAAATGTQVSMAAGGHDSQRALRLTGTCRNTWNYGHLRLPVPLQPAARYRLSGWMRVERVEPAKAPYVKVGVNAADGKWIDNFNAAPYDLRQSGTWQRFDRVFEVPLRGAAGDLAIERGGLEGERSVDLLLDDLRLELLDAP
ncbi:MAG: carbohydrate binding domain-containing protein [Fimbriimonadaceae bacterium]|nr:carbohydrate binding domain-containing protein [Fimbriimonadaceae bacterium]